MDRIILQDNIDLSTFVDFENEPQEGELTVIHFITRPNTVKYKSGWWVELFSEIFIQPVGTPDKFGLVYAHNSPIAPAKHYFSHSRELLHFTLFCPALPKGITHIDIIEKIGGSGTQFYNFYNVALTKIYTAPLIR